MIENVKIPIDHHTILVFWLFQNLLILLHLSESFDVPAGCCIISTTRKRSLGEVIFTGVCLSVILSTEGCPHVAIIHDALGLGTYPLPATDIW